MTVSTETVLMAKSRPRKNQSEGSDLSYHVIIGDTRFYVGPTSGFPFQEVFWFFYFFYLLNKVLCCVVSCRVASRRVAS